MGKLTLAILGATTALSLSGGPAAAYTATIYDSLTNPPPNNPKAYSHGWGDPEPQAPPGARWADNFNASGDDFYSGNAYVTWSGNDVIIELTSNLPLNGSPQTGSARYGFADVFFDLKAVDGLGGANTPDWDFGLDINSGRTDDGFGGFGQRTINTDKSAGKTGVRDPSYKTVMTEPVLGAGNKARLVTLDSTADYAYSVKDQIEWTKICTDGVDCGAATSGRRPEVEILETAYRDEYDVQTVGGPNPPDYTYRIVLAGVNDGGLWNEFRLFWGTGWCANDTVEGYVTRIPVPAALPIIASALVGFGFAGWRQRKAIA